MKLYKIALSLAVLFEPFTINVYCGDIDNQGGRARRKNCEFSGSYNNQYHYHPEKMSEKQNDSYEKFRDRLYTRLLKRFADDGNIWSRVNSCIEKRFDYMCSK